ncbi:hypothetical protein BJ165DRAFT_1502382 [Panaeolus papilionaceus]|nr:hypothetical protein BJ165DRAFT_1502382 [Panaeolus papilionaceus]
MPTKDNFSVWIEVEGRSLPEYGITISKEDQSVECWVPSELNKPFEICVYDSIRSYSSAFDVRVDGNDVSCGRVIVKSDEETKRPSTRVRGYQLTKRTMQSFYFSQCILLDPDIFNSSVLRGVGQIEVEIEQVRLRKTRATPRKRLTIPPLFLNERVHKGIDHGIRVGDEIQKYYDPFPTFATQRVRYLGTFIFKYRPIEVLRAHELVPHFKRPSMTPEVIDLTEEAEELQRRVAELKGMVSFLERQISNLNGRLSLPARV